MQLLDRPGDAWAHGRALLLGSHEPRSRQRRHVRQTIGLYKALRTAGVVRLLDEPDKYGRFVEVDHDLQDEFALDQLLAPFLLHAVPQLDASTTRRATRWPCSPWSRPWSTTRSRS